jgi:hypothetical protein
VRIPGEKLLEMPTFSKFYDAVVRAGGPHPLRFCENKTMFSRADGERALSCVGNRLEQGVALIYVDFLALFSPFSRQYHEIYEFTA